MNTSRTLMKKQNSDEDTVRKAILKYGRYWVK